MDGGVALGKEKLEVRRFPQHQVGPGQIEILISIANVVEAQSRDRIGKRGPNGVVQESLVQALPLFSGKLCTVVADLEEGDDQDVRPESKDRSPRRFSSRIHSVEPGPAPTKASTLPR